MAFTPGPASAGIAGRAQPVRSLRALAKPAYLPGLPQALDAPGASLLPLRPPLPSQTLECGACLKRPPHLSHCVAVLDYGYPWQKLITRYKFEGDLGLTCSLAHLIGTHEQALHCLQRSDALLPVPASAARVRERGFDHMDLLARSLVRQTGYSAPILSRAVQRRHVDLPQHSASRQQRLRRYVAYSASIQTLPRRLRENAFCCSTM